MVQSYPVSGSFSRSAVNLQAGAQSWVSSAFTSLAVLAALLFFTPLLYHLPLSVLAAVIMMAVVGLVNISGFVHAWKAQWYDGAISVITFAATLAFAPHLDRGIFIGVGLSLLFFLYKSMRPEVVNLSVGPDGALHDAAHSGLAQCRHLAMIRFEGPLFFANASFLEEQIRDRRLSMPELRHIHIVAEGISEIDASGEAALSHIVDRVRRAGFGISFSGLHRAVRDVLERTGLLKKIGRENIFPDEASALKAVYGLAHRRSSEGAACPLAKALRGRDGDAEKS
jgi:MFS superfamily sulfate permease-like transporter